MFLCLGREVPLFYKKPFKFENLKRFYETYHVYTMQLEKNYYIFLPILLFIQLAVNGWVFTTQTFARIRLSTWVMKDYIDTSARLCPWR